MFKKSGLVLTIIFVIIDAVYWFKLGGQDNVIVRNILYLTTPLIAAISGIFALREYGFSGGRVRMLILLTLGMASWFIGELIFYLYEFIFKINPFPSIADFFYVIAYPLMFGAFIYEINQVKVDFKKIRPEILFLFLVASVAIGILVIYFGIYLAYDAHESLFTNFIAMAYGVGDLMLILADMLLLNLIWEFRGGRLSRVYLFLFISFIFTMVADILFAIYSDQYKGEVWLYKSLIDTMFMAGYLFFAKGLIDFGLTIAETKNKLLAVK